MCAMNMNETTNHHHREEGGLEVNNDHNPVRHLGNGDHSSLEMASEDPTHSLVLDLGSVSFLDTVGISALKSIIADYEKIGITVVMAHCKGTTGLVTQPISRRC